MGTYITNTYSNGEKLLNLFTNKIITEIEKDSKNHISEIRLVNHNNFIVSQGKTTHKNPFNISNLLTSYHSELFGNVKNFNIIDLIEYDSKPNNDVIFIHKTFNKSTLSESLENKSNDDTKKGMDYRYTANTDINVILSQNNLSDENLIDSFKNFKQVEVCLTTEIFKSSLFFGKNLRSSKLFELYFNYIVYNIFERNLCKDLTITFFTDSEFNSISWENIDLKVTSNSLIVSEEWLTSMILDLFSFKPDDIISKWDLSNYNFDNEILNPHNLIWKVKDKIGEIILF